MTNKCHFVEHHAFYNTGQGSGAGFCCYIIQWLQFTVRELNQQLTDFIVDEFHWNLQKQCTNVSSGIISGITELAVTQDLTW